MLETTSTRNNYIGNGSTPNYEYDFKIFDRTHLQVIVLDLELDATTLVIDTDYTVSNIGDAAGGTVTLVSAAQAWISGGNLRSNYVLSILRIVPLDQGDDFANQEDFYPENHEARFDYQTMIDQQQQDEIDRCIKIPAGLNPASFDMILPETISTSAGRLVGVNTTGTGFSLIVPSNEAASAATASASAAAASASAATAAANAAIAAAFIEQWNEFSVVDGQAATDLTGQTVDGAVYTSAVYTYEILRGTTVLTNGWFALQYLNGTWVLSNGPDMGSLPGVTFSVSQVGTVGQLKAALDVGAGNGTVKVSRKLVPI